MGDSNGPAADGNSNHDTDTNQDADADTNQDADADSDFWSSDTDTNTGLRPSR